MHKTWDEAKLGKSMDIRLNHRESMSNVDALCLLQNDEIRHYYSNFHGIVSSCLIFFPELDFWKNFFLILKTRKMRLAEYVTKLQMRSR